MISSGRKPVSFPPYMGKAGVAPYKGNLEVAFRADIDLDYFPAGKLGSIDGAPVRVISAHHSELIAGCIVLVVEEVGP